MKFSKGEFNKLTIKDKAGYFYNFTSFWGTDLRFILWRRAYFMFEYYTKKTQMSRFLDFVGSSDTVWNIIHAQPHIIELCYRKWLYYQSTMEQRVSMIINHFAIMQEKLSEQQLSSVYHDKALTIWRDEALGLKAVLYYNRAHRKEGLLAINLEDSKGRLYMTDLWLDKDTAGKPVAYIGSLQGNSKRGEDYAVYTKVCHGMRPKNLIINIVRSFVKAMGIEKLMAVSDYGACVNHKLDKKRRIQFSMNTLWEELGGSVTGDKRFYELPLEAERRPLSELPTKRRAKHRKQYELLDALDEAIGKSMSM